MRTNYENKQLTAYENKAQPYVLVAVPAKPDMNDELWGLTKRVLAGFRYPRRSVAAYRKAIEPDPARCCYQQAEARNRLIAQSLKPYHTHILMMDADIVSTPPDLIERLLAVSTTDIVAPHVYVERLNKYQAPSFRNGGWFYDTGAFIQDGNTRDMWHPDLPGLQEMDSVGCCYLMPADLWRLGARYEPVGHEIDHLSFMRQAKAMGVRILATSEVVVEHAYLPKYGEAWHTWPAMENVS